MKSENNPSRKKSGGYKTAILLTSLMFFQVLASSSLIVSASTTPPSGSGDWTINAGEVAHVSSQVLIQGDVDVYGTLIIDDYGLYLWGANDWDREIIVHNGGRIELYNNSLISSYTSTCFGFTVNDGGELHVQDGIIQRACSLQISSRSEITLNQTVLEEGRIALTMPLNTCDTDIDLSINDLSIRNQTSKTNPTMTGQNTRSAFFLERYEPECNGVATIGEILQFFDVDIINICEDCIGLSIDDNWDSSVEINGFESYETSTFRPTVSHYDLWWPVIYINGNSDLYREITFRNASIYDQSHTVLQNPVGTDDQIITFDNFTAWNLINPTQDDLQNSDSRGVISYSHFLYRGYVPKKMDTTYNMGAGSDPLFGFNLIEVNSPMILKDADISGVWNNASYWKNDSSSGQSPFHNGLSIQCVIIHANNLSAENLKITDTCNTEVGTNIGHASDRACTPDQSYYRCYGQWSSTNTSEYYTDPTFGSGTSSCHRGNEFVGISLLVHDKLWLVDSEISDNNNMSMHFDYAQTGYSGHRHGQTRTHGLLMGDGYGGSGWDNGFVLEIINSSFSNNTQGAVHRNYETTSSSFHVINAELFLDIPQASTTYAYINNSFINVTLCPTTSSTHTNVPTFCVPILLDGPALTVTSTPYYAPKGMEDLISGEIIRKWDLEVRVTDPDYQWTPNATVEVYESNNWNVGSQSTGPNGGATNFLVKEYSRSTTSRYNYTPHSIQVTMTNYSNSTSVSVNADTSVIVYDPTPDDFPGDPTQDFDSDGDGYGDNQSGNDPDMFPNDPTQWMDTDGDGYGDNYSYTIDPTTLLRIQNGDAYILDNTQWSDIDGDGYGDNYNWSWNENTGLRIQEGDAFVYESTQWSDIDGDGYGDNPNGSNPDWNSTDGTQWQDTDGDNYGDNYTYVWNSATQLRDNQNGDAFVNDSSQWSDRDGDGHGDNASGTSPDEFPFDNTQWYDGDMDGLGDNQSGNNPDPYLNDSDNDGYNNSEDEFPWNPTQWEDNDNDGLGDNQSGTAADPYLNDTDNDGYNNSVDAFPYDPTQWVDADNDGYGDNPNGTNADPSLNDSDNDGVSNDQDDFPLDPTQTTDSDGDGYGDNASGFNPDAFPNNPAQWADTDGDGYGDNMYGSQGDMFPSDSTQWADTDGDGYGDNPLGNAPDHFPYEPSQWVDSDGDGWGDNATGTNPDAFPQDPTQWLDTDGDGYGDNSSGNMPDLFPYDNRQWSDVDNDGYGDNYFWSINQATGLRIQEGDAFYTDSSQYSDLDGDGYGDNSQGNNPDQFPTDSFQHTDSDGDGLGDNYRHDISQVTGLRENQEGDAFPSDSTQWSDTDGDGYGDNPNGNNSDWDPDDPTQWVDADNDGLGDNPMGNNPDPTPGDGDNDGVLDLEDAFPQDPNEVFDTDSDGIGDNADTDDDGDGWDDVMELNCNTSPINSDSTPLDSDGDGECNWNDSDDDNDGVEDSVDSCPIENGNSTFYVLGCPDTDGDTVSDILDTHPQNPYLSIDSDLDGYQDPVDPFPYDGTQWADFDNDGLGDNQQGNNPDPYLDDSDNDGVINQIDPFPLDPTQYEDIDRDGFGDNPSGNNPDPFPNDSDNDGYSNDIDVFRFDSTQWEDSDGDGYGDNPFGNLGDQFPNDPTQCCDRDGDGWGDNINGSNPDQFPDEITQWIDLDGDGLGDNPSGKDGDPYPNDSDNDGVANDEDIWPDDPDRSLDWDGDNISLEEEGPILDRVSQSHIQGIIAIILIALVVGIIIGTVFKIPRRN